MRTSRNEHGGLEIAEIFAGVLSAALLILVIMAIQQFGNTLAVYRGYQEGAGAVHTALAKMDEESASANAIFIPAFDVKGQSNSDGHECDILQIVVDPATKSNHAQFIAYRWNIVAKLLERWTYLHAPGSTPTQTEGFAVPATSFTAQYVAASQASTILPEASFLKNVAINDVFAVNMGYAGVDAGNREVHIAIANSQTSETDDLIQGVYSVRVNYIVGTFTPTPGPCPPGMVGTPPNCTLPSTPTPVPTPAPTTGPLTVWPIAVRYATAGNTLASNLPAPMNVATLLNALLGGKVASAAGCTAQAFRDTGFTQLDTNDTTYAAYGASTDANGCYNGNVVATESNYSQPFQYAVNTCSGYLSFGGWTPNIYGPQASLAIVGSQSTAGCTFTLSDASSQSKSASVPAQVVSEPCQLVGGTCTFTVHWLNDFPYCDKTSGAVDGYNGRGRLVASPAGIVNISPSLGVGPFTVTRVAPGAVTLDEQGESVNYSLPKCSVQSSFYSQGSIGISYIP